jgi:hypothetical protein
MHFASRSSPDPRGVLRRTSCSVETEQLELGTLDWNFSGWNAVLTLGYSFFGSSPGKSAERRILVFSFKTIPENSCF